MRFERFPLFIIFYALCVFWVFWVWVRVWHSATCIFNYFKHYNSVFGAGFTIFRVLRFSGFQGRVRHLNIFTALDINSTMAVVWIFYTFYAFLVFRFLGLGYGIAPPCFYTVILVI